MTTRRGHIVAFILAAGLLAALPILAQTGKAPHKAATTGSASRTASKPAASEPAAGAKIGLATMCLTGQLREGPPEFSLFGDTQSQSTLRDWLKRLAKARTDKAVTAVALEVDGPELTWAQAEELADAVRRLNEVKPVYTYFSSGSADDYLVASAGRQVSMDPTGELEIVGLAGEMMFFRGTLDKLGIRPQMVQIGKFKGAGEPMACTQPSKEYREITESLLDDLYSQLCQQISSQRKLSIEDVKAAIDEGPLSAEDALKHKFVDELVCRLDWEDLVACDIVGEDQDVDYLDDYGAEPQKDLNLSNPLSVLAMLMGSKNTDKIKDPTIAIIHADGVIVDGDSSEGMLGGREVGSKTLVDCFQEVRDDDAVKAVVFRIDSPGGSASASEQIYQAVAKCAEEKPVIVSIASVGASGGYYIAVGARTIIADPSGIVGSIGVISGKLAPAELMDKLGVTTFGMTRGKNAGLFLTRAWEPDEEAIIRRLAQRTYDTFVKRVTDSRGTKIKDITQVAEGRVFTARKAVKNGLVDSLGGLREAIDEAKRQAKIKDAYILPLPRPQTLMDVLGKGSQILAPSLLRTALPELSAAGGIARNHPGLAYMLNLAQIMDRKTVLTAMPYYLNIRR